MSRFKGPIIDVTGDDTKRGFPVVDVTGDATKRGSPVYVATGGARGYPVKVVASGGYPVNVLSGSIGSSPFTPADLFDGGYVGDWWDASDTNTVYSDAGGTTLITRGADTTAASWKGKANNTLISAGGAATRPLYKSANDTILFDGVDDYMISAGNVLTPYPLSIVAVVDKTHAGAGSYGGGAVSASTSDHVSIKVTSVAAATGFNDRVGANQFSSNFTMPSFSSALAAGFFRASTSTDARLLYTEGGSEASIAAPSNNTHAAGRVVVGASRHATGTPSAFGGVRLRALIVINKLLSVAECNNVRTYYGIA